MTTASIKHKRPISPEASTKLQEQKLSILEVAHKIIYGEREETYSDPGKNLRTIADYWNTHIKAAKSVDPLLTAEDVCVMMILLKQARLANTTGHLDSLVDTAGYAALYERIQN